MATPPPLDKQLVNIRFLMVDNYCIYKALPPSATIEQARIALSETWPGDRGPPPTPDALRIIFSGKVLEDQTSFSEMKFPLGERVTMLLSPRPGVRKEKPQQAKPIPTKTETPPAPSSRCNCVLL
eukprot:c32874_g1_i1.p1 GENE.c32874_g1_i1~~c32874_g1_i1.p1  ORF type:complete len:125 (-),score=15.46 c32874_g1_i1:80-454(-)